MSFFDEELQEVEVDKVRYILRCNNVRKKEMEASRNNKIKLIDTHG